MKIFFAVASRELKRIFTNRDLLTLCVFSPLFYGLLLSAVYAHHRVEKIPVGVVDEDRTRLSRTLIRYAGAAQSIEIAAHYESVTEAEQAVLAGRVTGLLVIPRDFSERIKRGEEAHGVVSVNAANFMVANPVMQSLMEVSNTLSAGVFANGMMKRGLTREKAMALARPIALDARPLFNPAMTYSDFILPGLLFVALQQIVLVGLGFTFSDERERGTARELHACADGSALAALAGKAAPYFFVNFLMAVLFITWLLPAFGVPV